FPSRLSHPLTSPLFTYTTLFRSHLLLGRELLLPTWTYNAALIGQVVVSRGRVVEFCHAWIKSKLGLRQFRVRGLVKVHMEMLWADRKSTRLNSSHQIISYAVFCL